MEQEAFFQYTPATMPNDYQADRYVWSDIVPSGFPTSHSMMAPYAAAPLDIPYFRSQVHGPYDRYGRPTDPMAMPWPDLPQPLPPMAPPIPEQHTEGHQRQRQTTLPDPARKKTISYIKPSNGDDVVFHTPVDVMMRALQKKDDVASSSSKAGAYSVKSEPSTPQANHQNKYHKQTITTIADWITSLTDVNALSHTDRELLSYFENIYKNSNKGIKGRGRDRQVSEVRGKTKKLPRKLLPSLGI
ncbi:hypothetical protein ACHAQF_008399 [Verticillium nonalfalfae]|nr:hypothetical protein VD0004_g5468 [Verticillium dahliae]